MSNNESHIQRQGDSRRHRVNMISEAVVARYIHDLSALGRVGRTRGRDVDEARRTLRRFAQAGAAKREQLLAA